MDRQAVLGFVLIFVVLMVWMWMSAPQPKPPGAVAEAERSTDTVAVAAPALEKRAPVNPIRDVGRFFDDRLQGRESVLIIETDQLIAVVTSRGALLRKWELKGF